MLLWQHGNKPGYGVSPSAAVVSGPDVRALAKLAAEFAAAAPGGSLDRRAYGCVSVAFVTCRTVAAARKALADVGPPEVRAAALARLAELERRPA